MTPSADLDDVRNAIERIARRFEAVMLDRSPLHLVACAACKGPSFQQPCPNCGYYPMGSQDAQAQRDRTKAIDADGFRKVVERTGPDGGGNLATWYYGQFRRSSAYRPHSSYAARVDALVAEGAAMGGLPSPGAVHGLVAATEQSIGRERVPPEVPAIWAVLHEVRSALSREDEATSRGERPPVRLEAGTRGIADAAGKAVVEAVHGDDAAWDGAIDGLAMVLDRMADLHSRVPGPGTAWIPIGNVLSARNRLEGIRDRRAGLPPEGPAFR